MTAKYMVMKTDSSSDNDNSFRRQQIERQLNSMERLFDDHSDAESCSDDSSSGESMANDDVDDIDFRDGAKAKVLQLWGGGELGSLTVDAATSQPTSAKFVSYDDIVPPETNKPLEGTTTSSDQPQDTVETLASSSTDTNRPLGRSGSDHGNPASQRPPMASTSRMRKSSSADNMKKHRASLLASRGSSRPSATMNESFTLDDSLLAKLPTKGVFSRRRGDELSKSEHGSATTTSSSLPSKPLTSRPRVAPARTSSTSSSSSRSRRAGAGGAGGGELSRSEHGSSSRNPRSPSLSRSNTTTNNELSRSELGRRSNRPSLTARKRGTDAGDLSGCDSDASTTEPKVRSNNNGGGVPRRVRSSGMDIDRISTRLSRREIISSSLDVAASATTISSNKNAQWDNNNNNLDDLDRRSQLKRTMSLTTRKRGGDLSSKSEHGTIGSSSRSSRISSSRGSRSGGGGGLSRASNHSQDSEDMDLGSQTSRGSSTRAPRRVKSSGAEVSLMGRVPRKTSSSSQNFEGQDTKNAQWGAAAPPQQQQQPGPLSYGDMKQKYQQGWDAATCLVAVNEERTKHSLRSLTRDKELDAEAQKHAEAIAQSNGNYVLKISYIGHVLKGMSVKNMHKAAMQPNYPSKNVKMNILNPDFTVMGVGVATGDNGIVYVCELYHGQFTLCCCDTTMDQSP